MSIQTASVHAAVFGVQHPAPQAGSEVGRRLSPLLGLRTAVGGVQGERGAGGDRVGAAGVLFPQVLRDDAVEGRGGRKVALQLLLHGWSLIQREFIYYLHLIIFTYLYLNQTEPQQGVTDLYESTVVRLLFQGAKLFS